LTRRNLSDWFSVEATVETVRRRRTRLRTTPAGEQFDNRVNALKPPKSAPADLMPRDSDHVNAARAKAEKERQRSTKEKTQKFFDLLNRGASRATMAAVLDLPLEGVDELMTIAREGSLEGEGGRDA